MEAAEREKEEWDAAKAAGEEEPGLYSFRRQLITVRLPSIGRNE